MKRICNLVWGGLASVAILQSAHGQLTPDQKQLLPPAADRTVDFAREIQPILQESCAKCHAKGSAKGGFNFESREALLREADSGPAVVLGNSGDSYLIELVAGIDPDNVMPKKGSRLSPEAVGLLRAWIDQGVAWDDSITFAKPPALNLKPNRPELPPARGDLTHPIDRLLSPYNKDHGVRPEPSVADRVFARRVYLDIIGLLPEPKELEAFLRDRRPDKRERLVDTLLADNRRYAEHWLSFWNDLLRNDYRGTGYIDGGRKQISTWLFSALATNMPFDRFVAELIDPVPESEGFIKGIVWRGVVNASQRPPVQAAQNVSQVFMGINLKCASCHDSFINDWTLADSYALASVFSDEPMEMYRCDKPTGETAGVGFLFPELGEIPSDLPRAEKQNRLAGIMTSRENGRLTRTIVNRLWQRFMGRGLIEPVDDMQQTAWHQDLLDWLAEDLAGHGYDLKHTMRRILTSQAYQRPAVDLPERVESDYVFTGPGIRRMTAEQFRDAMGRLTDVWFEKPSGKFNFSVAAETTSGESLMPESVHWIWKSPNAARRADAEHVYWRKEFHLETLPEIAEGVVTCDNSFTLWLNGIKLAEGGDFKKPGYISLQGHLRQGKNFIAIQAVNHKPNNQPPRADESPNPAHANPAGLLAYFRLRRGDSVRDIASDHNWVWTTSPPAQWNKAERASGTWQAAHELGGAEAAPWQVQAALQTALLTGQAHEPIRASLVESDPLTRALGRPPREQLLTTRNPTATTLQALELTNGDTLTGILQKGADYWLASAPAKGSDLVQDIFKRALGREPTRQEERLSRQLVGSEPAREGVEDLLWSIAMLPEFQLIY